MSMKRSGMPSATSNTSSKLLQFIDKHLSTNEWLVGSNFTAADIMNVFFLATMRAFSGLDLSEYPHILEYLKRCTEQNGYKRARAKGDPDLELMIDSKAPAQFLQKLKEEGKI